MGLEAFVSTVYSGENGTVVTDGHGGLRPYIPDGVSPGSLEYRIIEFHEQVHIRDIYIEFLKQDVESRERLRRAVDGQRIKMSAEATIKSEINAWGTTLSLLQMMLSDQSHPFRRGASDAELKIWEAIAQRALKGYQRQLNGCGG
jgi:hypothetical protein